MEPRSQRPITHPTMKLKDIVSNVTLGTGSYGSVFLGKWNNGWYAIKKTHDQSSFDREVEILTLLRNHQVPNVVQFYGVIMGDSGSYHFHFAMEYVSGGSLYNLIRELRPYSPLDWSVRYKIMTGIAVAVRGLHGLDLQHRDLKIDNVLLTDDYHVKLCDFGYSIISKEDTTGVCVGTTSYLAPETAEHFIFSKMTDIYTIGLMFWEITAWTIVFLQLQWVDDDDQFLASTLQLKKSGEPEKIPAHCPPKIAHLISWCWKERGKRPTIEQVEDTVKKAEQASRSLTI